MEKIDFDINKVICRDLDGRELPLNPAKTVGNVIYMKATTLEWDQVARDIHAGKPVKLSRPEIEALKGILLSPDTPMYLTVKKPLKDYFETLNNLKNE